MEIIDDKDFWKPRRCLREPIPEIFHAAFLLDRAVGAHLTGDHSSAAKLIQAANMPVVRAWTESLWGKKAANPDQWKYFRLREINDIPPILPEKERSPERDPTPDRERAVIECYGRNCVFCGIPLIHKNIRIAIGLVYPNTWGRGNLEQHAALQCMWMQFDHIIPHSRGGDSSAENLVVTCAPCNNGRGNRMLDEVGLIDPRTLPTYKTSWDGLERFSPASRAS